MPTGVCTATTLCNDGPHTYGLMYVTEIVRGAAPLLEPHVRKYRSKGATPFTLHRLPEALLRQVWAQPTKSILGDLVGHPGLCQTAKSLGSQA